MFQRGKGDYPTGGLHLRDGLSSTRVLAHVCCAPCAVFAFPRLQVLFKEVVGLWYNPNIHPLVEYNRRLDSVKDWSRQSGTRVLYEEKYELKSFLRQIAFREEQRCVVCYYMRFRKVAAFARHGNFEYFTSTLLVSPHQNQDLMRKIACEAGKEYGVRPYLAASREGWKESRNVSHAMGLYHQQYCGCIYSEEERFSSRRSVRDH